MSNDPAPGRYHNCKSPCGTEGCLGWPAQLAADAAGVRELALNAAAAEIDALIAVGDAGAMGAWFEANRDRRVRHLDAGRLLAAIRDAVAPLTPRE